MYYLARPHSQKFIYRKKRLSEEIREGYKMLIGTLVFLSLATGFFYIRMQTEGTVLGYHLSELKAMNEDLKNKNYDLTHKVLDAESVLSLEYNTYSSSMVAIDGTSVAYVKETDMAVLPIRVEDLNR